jgi:hypothetical protein
MWFGADTESLSGLSEFVNGKPDSVGKRAEVVRGCVTGDSLLDSRAVQDSLKEMWTRSDPSGPLADRREWGGFLIWADGKASFTRFPDGWARGPAEIEAVVSDPLPAGTAAWIHSHPFAVGDTIKMLRYAIIDVNAPGGFRWPVYKGQPSGLPGRRERGDRGASYAWNKPGYLIDKGGYNRFTSTDSARVTTTPGGSAATCFFAF